MSLIVFTLFIMIFGFGLGMLIDKGYFPIIDLIDNLGIELGIGKVNKEKRNLKKYYNTVVYDHTNFGFTEYGALVKGYARKVIDVKILNGELYYVFEGNNNPNPFTKKRFYRYNTEFIEPITQAEIDETRKKHNEEFVSIMEDITKLNIEIEKLQSSMRKIKVYEEKIEILEKLSK